MKRSGAGMFRTFLQAYDHGHSARLTGTLVLMHKISKT